MHPLERLHEVCQEYRRLLKIDLKVRLQLWMADISKDAEYSVVGGLIARQISIASEFSRAPEIWNHHVAPLFHRALVDVYINMAWILKSPADRSQLFLEYGLGQAKLSCEHRKAQLEKDKKDPKEDPLIRATESWINGQKFEFLVNVDVGAWAGISTREMAEQADCIDLYNYVYVPFSPCVHSTWSHVGRLNIRRSASALHRNVMIPDVPDLSSDLDELFLAAKYVEKAFRLFDASYPLGKQFDSRLSWLEDKIAEIGESMKASQSPDSSDDGG